MLSFRRCYRLAGHISHSANGSLTQSFSFFSFYKVFSSNVFYWRECVFNNIIIVICAREFLVFRVESHCVGCGRVEDEPLTHAPLCCLGDPHDSIAGVSTDKYERHGHGNVILYCIILLYLSRARYNNVASVTPPRLPSNVVWFGRLPVGRCFCSLASGRPSTVGACVFARARPIFKVRKRRLRIRITPFCSFAQGLAQKTRAHRVRPIILDYYYYCLGETSFVVFPFCSLARSAMRTISQSSGLKY
ncbi:hypothetical protein AGLY_000059 [Aphis glycines]|uniref:Uncharacterized protein n=1 Tax=Aphis glycines TaxID=307491 RepID=A0A6G0U5X6_APHGL|nr:hypothetical protein AGLY_000059 [Aphis glycines]